MDGLCPGSTTMSGAPSAGLTTRRAVDGRELVGLGFGLERVGVGRRLGVLLLAAVDVCVGLDDAVGVGVGALERAPVEAVEEHAAVTPRTHTAPATRPAKRSRPHRFTQPP
jgi:hypothetical protein